MNRLSGIALSVCSVLLMAGCLESGTPAPALDAPVPVSGIIKMDGQPIEQATVQFHPKEGTQGNGAAGVTDKEGKYTLSTRIGTETKPGVVPGEYKVSISRMVKADGSVIPFDPDTPPMNIGGQESIPKEYSDFGLTKLTAKVPGGTFDFDVKSK